MKSIIVIVTTVVALTALSVPVMVSAQGGGKLVACEGADDCSFEKLIETARNVMNYLVQIAVALAVIIISYAGFVYLTAAGNTGKISQAHKMMTAAVIGFLVVLAAWLIVEVILNTLKADSGVIQVPDFFN